MQYAHVEFYQTVILVNEMDVCSNSVSCVRHPCPKGGTCTLYAHELVHVYMYRPTCMHSKHAQGYQGVIYSCTLYMYMYLYT